MSDQPGTGSTAESGEPLLRAGTWQPRPRRPEVEAPPESGDETTTQAAQVPEPTDDLIDVDPLRLAPDELPWGVPARAASPDGVALPPADVLESRPSPLRIAVIVVAVVVVVLLMGLLALIVFQSRT
jgi:hypothetical protein